MNQTTNVNTQPVKMDRRMTVSQRRVWNALVLTCVLDHEISKLGNGCYTGLVGGNEHDRTRKIAMDRRYGD
jgi:hypothetical protein